MGDKKKAKIQASEIIVNSRALDNVLLDLAEQIKANDARYAERAAQMAERTAQIEARTAQIEERTAQIEERTARSEELIQIALQTIAAVSQDLRALAQRTDTRLTTLEKATAAE
jgi:chromosome segregation ATPase